MKSVFTTRMSNRSCGSDLVMPAKFVTLDCYEMECLDGGYQVWANSIYLSKSACLIKAGKLFFGGKVTGMGILGIAQEIYAHNYAYYLTSGLVAIGLGNDTINTLRYHANPCDIENGGDSFGMRTVYALIWGVYVLGT